MPMPTCVNPACNSAAEDWAWTCAECSRLRESSDPDVCDLCHEWIEGGGYDPAQGEILCTDCREEG